MSTLIKLTDLIPIPNPSAFKLHLACENQNGVHNSREHLQSRGDCLVKTMAQRLLYVIMGLVLVDFLAPSHKAHAQDFDEFWDIYNDPTVLDHYQTNRGVLKSYETTFFDGDNRLKLTIDSDYGFEDSGFRFQGLERRYGPDNVFWNNPVNTGFAIDLYIDPDWLHNGNQREISFWPQLTGSNSYWPSFGFYTDGQGTANFQSWPEQTSDNYQVLNLPSSFAYGWNTISYILTETGNVWSLNGEEFWVNDAWFESHFQPDNIQTVLIMPRNFAEDDYVIYLDNFRAIPEASSLMLLAVTAGVPLVWRRIRMNARPARRD